MRILNNQIKRYLADDKRAFWKADPNLLLLLLESSVHHAVLELYAFFFQPEMTSLLLLIERMSDEYVNVGFWISVYYFYRWS